QVLRRTADGGVAEELVPLTDGGGTFDACVGADRGAGADGDLRSDQHVCADLDAGGELRLIADDRCGMDSSHMDYCGLSVMTLSISASATTTPSTVATPRMRMVFERL